MGSSETSILDLEFIGPRDAKVAETVKKALADEQISARASEYFTFAESAVPPVQIIIKLTIEQIEGITIAALVAAYGKSIAEELGKDTYAAAKRAFRALGRGILKGYERIKITVNRESYYTVRIRRDRGRDSMYNVPGADVEDALASLIDDVLENDRDPSRGDLFWDFGRWMDYDEHEAFHKDEDARDRTEPSEPTSEFLRACDLWRSIVGSAPVISVLGNGRDALIEVPKDISATVRDEAIRVLREALRNSKIGPTPKRYVIFVSDAMIPLDSNYK
jgi:hypothetical protein